MQPMVRKIAIGSLAPLSISRVAATFSRRRTPAERRMERTAAASVDPTMLPRRSPSRSGMSRMKAAAIPVTTAVTSTPNVARTEAGFQTSLSDSTGVRRPPSKRMTARATVPMPCASR